jgi:hypothetical protein
VDILKQVIGYLRIRITTLRVFEGAFSRTLSRKYLKKWVSLETYKGVLSSSALGTEGRVELKQKPAE